MTSIFKWLVAWKRGLPRPKVSYKNLSPPPNTITKNLKKVLYGKKVIEVSEAPEGIVIHRALFRFYSDRVLLKVLFASSVTSSPSGPSVIDSSLRSSVFIFPHAPIFYQNMLLLFLKEYVELESYLLQFLDQLVSDVIFLHMLFLLTTLSSSTIMKLLTLLIRRC